MFRTVAGLLVLLLLSPSLAGCLSPAADETVLPAEAEVDALAAVEAAVPYEPTAPTAAAPEWYVSTVTASPEGALGAAWWTLPEGAVVPWSMNDEFDADDTVVVIELAPIVPADKRDAVRAWGLVAFEDEDGALAPINGFLDVPSRTVIRGAGMMPVESEHEVTLDPVFARLAYNPEPNETLALVLVAVADEPLPFSVAWRVLDHDPEDDEEPVESADAFVAARTTPAARVANVAGSGFSAHAYGQIVLGGFPAGPSMQIETWVGDAEGAVTGLPVPGGPHAVEASAAGTLDAGWAIAYADHVSLGVEAVEWALRVESRGESQGGQGIQASAWPVPVGGASFAGAGAFLIQEGDGASSASLSLRRAQASALVSFGEVGVFELGATLEELFGMPSVRVSEMGTSGVGTGGMPTQWLRTPAREAFHEALAAHGHAR